MLQAQEVNHKLNADKTAICQTVLRVSAYTVIIGLSFFIKIHIWFNNLKTDIIKKGSGKEEN